MKLNLLWIGRNFLFALWFALPLGAAAGIDLEHSLVKIISSNPKTSFQLNGSGFLFTYRNLALVITSEHILAPSTSEETQVRMKTSAGETYELQTLKSDWGIGLALLRVVDKIPQENLSNLVELQKQGPSTGKNVVSAGYPASSEGLLLDPDGVLKTTRSDLRLFLDIPFLIEVQSAMTEFGMSGGLLLSEELDPLGVLSHKSGSGQNITFAIPIKEALDWTQKTIDDADFRPILTRKNFASSTTILAINTGNFEISWRPRDGISIYHLRDGEVSYAKNFPHPFFEDAEVLSSAYMGPGSRSYPYVHLFGFRPPGLLNIQGPLVYPKDLIDFFVMLRNPRLQPVGYVWFGNGEPGYDWQRMGQALPAFRAAYANYRRNFSDQALDPYLNALYQALSQTSQSTEGQASIYERLSPRDIDFVLQDASLEPAWKRIRSHQPELEKALRQSLQELKKSVQHYVL